MINGIVEIGKKMSAGSIDEFLKSKVINREYKLFVKVNFDTNKKIIQLIPENFSVKDAQEHYWIGNNKGSERQARLTTDNLSYLLTQSISNLYKEIESGDLKGILHDILQKFSTDQANQAMIDISYIENIDLQNPVLDKKAIKSLLDKHLLKILGLKKNELGKILYTAYYNNQKLVDFPEYKEFLYSELIKKTFDENSHQGRCYLCNKGGKVTSNFTKFKLKFFINQKISFASGLKKDGFQKNYALCEDCFKAFSVGESFVENYLKTSLARTSCYIIPEFYDQSLLTVSGDVFKKMANDYIKSVEALNKNERWAEYRMELLDVLKTDLFALNFVFVEISNSAVKIQKLIQDVPPSRLTRLFSVRLNVAERFKRFFAKENIGTFILDFSKIFYLFPVRKSGSKAQSKDILEIYATLLTGKKIKETTLVNDFMEIVRMHKFENYQSYYHSPTKNTDIAILNHLILSNVFLVMLRELEIIEGGGVVVNIEEIEKLDEELADYIRMMDFDNQKTGLFLLGVIISSIATEQYKIDGKKPILDKLNYQGMSLLKIKNLANELFDKMRQYRALNAYTEQVYSLAKQLIDLEEKNWHVTPQENVYYILSGYSYKTKKTIEGGIKDE